MPVTIKSAPLKYKNSSGEFVGINAIAEASTAQQLAAISQAGAAQIAAIEADIAHSPIIGQNGNWFTWDVDEQDYVDSGEPSRGIQGPVGPQGAQGEAAPAATVTTAVDAYLTENFTNPSNPPLDRTLLSSSSAAPADLVGDLKSAFDDLDNKLYEEIEYYQKINLSSTEEFSVTEYANRNGNVGDTGISAAPRNIQLQVLADYTSYSFRPSEAIDIYCDAGSATYYALSYLENPISEDWNTSGTILVMLGSASVRYRKNESNLPSSNNPLTIPAGSQVVVTVPTGTTPAIYCKQNVKGNILKAQNLGGKYPFLSVEMHTDYIYYYMPTNSGNWLRYKFNHFVDQASNANGWVQRNVDLVSADKETVIFPVITNGEWEMAIQLSDRPDFIGCQNHGSEVSTIVSFMFDGVEKAITDGTAFDCASIKVIEKSTMYDPNDETTIVGYHYKTYEITTNGIKIRQRIEWIADNTAMKSYVMMIPAVRGNDNTSSVQVTDRAYDDYHMVICNVATTTFNPTDVSAQNYKGNTLCLYGTTSGIAITGECIIKNPSTSVFAFLSNATYYNKWYYGYCGDNYPITSGDVWEWESTYKITYND